MEERHVALAKERDLKYGENPNQRCAIYTLNSINDDKAFQIPEFTQLKSVR